MYEELCEVCTGSRAEKMERVTCFDMEEMYGSRQVMDSLIPHEEAISDFLNQREQPVRLLEVVLHRDGDPSEDF